MLSVEDLGSAQENSAHRSSESAHRSAAGGEVTETIAVSQTLLAPVLGEISAAWWGLRKRYTMTSRSRRYGESERVMRFFTRKGRDRAMRAYLDAHRRVYRYYSAHVPIT